MTETIAPIEYKKEKWGDGPWQTEPDRMQWINSGFSCLAVRSPFGNWCGYVGVPKEHPAFGKHYDDVKVSVHGGLTYACKCEGAICHIPKKGMPANVWWLGFDCAHSGDLSPGLKINFPFLKDVYRDVKYIRRETNRLAKQLRGLK